MVSKKQSVEEFSTQLSAQIWGHRFKDGQKGPEYVLEFLNVLKGTNYDFSANAYSRVRSTGLRQFIFEGDKEGAKMGVVSLTTEQKDSLYGIVENKDEIHVIRDFFRNLEIPLTDGTGKPANRSWFAKTLYPLHESLLFFELRTHHNKNAGTKSYSYERNFFARGGELYFLMLSYGTDNNLELRSNIENRLKTLLNKNKTIENVVYKISSCLNELEKDESLAPLKQDNSNKEYPTLPTTDDPIFEEFAQEFFRLISLNIDIYEMFELLTSLITFQLGRYMLKRAKLNNEDLVTFFFDCLDAQVGPVQKLSAKSFSDNELLIKNKFENYFIQTFNEKIPSEEFVMENLESWHADPEMLIELLGLNRLSKVRKNKVYKVIQKCDSYDKVMNHLFNVVKEIVSDQLKKHQLNIVRGLTRDGGYGGYRRGSKYRYFMSDTFIQALVYANLQPGKQMEFHSFLEKVYRKYGFIIGEVQAKENGIYEKSKLNVSYFQRNEYALREKLRHNGLLIEFSDATAMIRNPYEQAGQVKA
ncbi:hypothetical protein FZC84_00990 [Rossellomorea vietnamensis]|uniref:Uncharacterized protein n=1 Tax=Rossellomorea vietnamensis TaxID=218284 RepID=A0A5D4MJV1_9BACI|nr:hypothetical protein [Rossellomorea vietnamensis]TYS01266.1 hypothetical protein FZC84_00990 [Rossellomorea vietnamensis]